MFPLVALPTIVLEHTVAGYDPAEGEVPYLYAAAFATVNRTLTDEQRSAMMKLRNLDGYTSAPAYIYSDPVEGPIEAMKTDAFFTKAR